MHTWFDSWALTLVVFIPAIGAVITMLLPRAEEAAIKWVVLLTTLATLGFTIAVVAKFDFDKTSQLQFNVNKELDRRHQQPLPRGCRRHRAADARVVVVHHGVVRHLLVEPLPRAAQPEGVPRAAVDPRGRDERHVRRPGPHLVLRLLRDRPAPDVLHDRGLGRTQPRVRVDQVLLVHAVRLGADAVVVPRALLQGRRTGRRAHLRHGVALEGGTARGSCTARSS